MAVYSRQVQTAKRLIAKYGQKVTVVTKEFVIPDPLKPWDTELGNVVHEDIPVAFFNLNSRNMASLTTMVASEVPKGAHIAYMASVPFEVNLQTSFIRDGKPLSIYYLDTLAPNGEKILHTLVLGE